ncbi:MAG TPA: helix-turn-helix domain-containing protein [Pseudonocardia sp.]|nr:helix-turn-helix domain-containing protein [Pseudonocardia sp.]
MSDPLEARLRAEEIAVRRAVVEGAGERPGREHVEVTEALVAAVFVHLLGLLPGMRRDPAADLRAMREIGSRYAAARVPQGQVLYEFHRTVIEVSRRSWAVAAPGDVELLLELSQLFERQVDQIRSALTEGYCVAFAASGTRSTSRRELLVSLLTGQPVNRRLALAANVALAQNYLVMCATPPVAEPNVDEIAGRLQSPGALVGCEDGRLWVLMPVSRVSIKSPREVADRGFARLAAAAGVTVAGAGLADVAGVPDAAEEALGTLEIAEACERRGGVLAEQVLVERALTGSSTAMTELAGLVAALSRWPYLQETLRSLYEHDLDRSRTAAALHIARRTLSKRLDRIHQLTGVNPTSAQGVQIFLSALAADRLSRDRDDSGAPVEVG